jgi:hypothetical protein
MSAATDLLNRLSEDLERMESSKKPNEVVRVLYGGVFGAMRVSDIQPASHDSIRVVVGAENGATHVIIAPVAQCSFMLSIVPLVAGEPPAKVILGFSQR